MAPRKVVRMSMPSLHSVNLGRLHPSEHTAAPNGMTGIDKRPVSEPVEVKAPGPKGVGGSGLVGDRISDLRAHGGTDQAVYVYAREDLDEWQSALGRELSNGCFGENLTTVGLAVSAAKIGARWRIGADVVVEVSSPRIPCRTFAGWLGERGWVKTFTQRARPGVYLRMMTPGWISAGDPVEVIEEPDHDVTAELAFRAFTGSPELLPRLLVADALPEEDKRRVAARTGFTLDDA